MTPDDAAVLRMLAGAHFRTGATLALPSGIIIDAAEANVLTAAYMPDSGLPDRTLPAHLAKEPVSLELADYVDMKREADELRAALTTAQREARDGWRCTYALLAALVLLCALVGYLAATWPT